MTPPPELEPVAAQLYSDLEPLAYADPDNDYALARLLGAIGAMYQPVDTLARDTPAGPGWSAVVDLERAPAAWLPWLAQFVGVSLIPGSSEAEQRDRIARTDGFKRGTPEALRAAIEPTLTGQKRVFYRERFGGAYLLTIHTQASETPSPAATLAAILAQKPAGIVLTYTTLDGQDYAQLKTDPAGNTYAQMTLDYPTYNDVLANF